MTRYFLIIFCFLLFSCDNREKQININLIAHAGGCVNGIPMTNSLEALHSARDNGFKYIELDLGFTSDSILVAVHSWNEYNISAGMPEKGNKPPSYEEFRTTNLKGGLTPLTANDINDFFLSNDTLFFVTDKISDAKILEHYFPKLKKRMIVEAFSYEHYAKLKSKGYAYVFYSCMAKDIHIAPLKHLIFYKLFSGPKIEYVALHTSAFEHLYLKLLNYFANFKIALFTVNNLEDIPLNHIENIKFLYSDSLLPQILNNRIYK